MSTSFDKPNGLEKILRWAFPVGGILLGMKFFTSHIAPFFTSFFNAVNGFFGSALGAFGSFLAFLIVVFPFAFLVLYFYNRPHMLSNIYLGMCRAISRAIIKYDPLGHMDSFVQRLVEKHSDIKKTIVSVDAKRIEIEREFKASHESFQSNMELAKAAKDVAEKHRKDSIEHSENMQLASHHAEKASSDKENVDKYKPTWDLIKKQLVILTKIETKLKYDIDAMKHDIKNKRRQYETIRKTAAASKMAQDFINGNSKEAHDFQIAVDELEVKMTNKIAAIEQFEKDSKMLMQSFDLQKQVNANEGMKLLEQYEQNGDSIFFAEKNPSPLTLDADAKVVSSKPLNSEFAALLSKKSE